VFQEDIDSQMMWKEGQTPSGGILGEAGTLHASYTTLFNIIILHVGGRELLGQVATTTNCLSIFNFGLSMPQFTFLIINNHTMLSYAFAQTVADALEPVAFQSWKD
jgi:hypothetical protein